jgi:dolichol-phosphate mannosyltransferase
VIGVRDRKHIPRLHKLGNWVISQVFSLLFSVKTTDVCSGMYLLSTADAKRYNVKEPGFVVEVELAAQSASKRQLTEVPISYRERIGTRKLSTWRHGISILLAALTLAREYNPVFLYSALAAVAMIPSVVILGWALLEKLTTGIWHSTWALVGAVLLVMSVQAISVASISILMRHTEERLMDEVRRSR